MKREEKVIDFVHVRQNQGGTMPQKAYSNSAAFSAEDVIMFNGEILRIAYSKSEDTCFVDKWRNPNSKIAEAPQFKNGKISVKESEKCLLEFLRLNNRCEGNETKLGNSKTVYREVNIEKIVNESLEKMRIEKKASDLYWDLINAGGNRAQAIARSLGVYSTAKGSVYQMNLKSYADGNAADFISKVEDAQWVQSAERLDFIHEANDKQFIIFSQGRWFWKVGGEPIIAVPNATDRHEYLNGYTFSSREGGEVWNNIARLLGQIQEVGSEVVVKAPITISSKEKAEVDAMPLDKLLSEFKKIKMVVWSAEFKRYEYTDGDEVIGVGMSANKEGSTSSFEYIMQNDTELADHMKADYVLRKKAKSEE